MKKNLVGGVTENNVKPIKPSEVGEMKRKIFPDAAFEAFNELILQGFCDGSVTILQKNAVALMVKKGLKSDEIFSKNWLDVEEAYRSAGWDVEFDSPAYCESYDASFKFTPKKRGGGR